MMEYREISNHYFGFVDLSLSLMSARFPEFFEHLSMLVTCLDSNPQLSSQEGWLRYLRLRGVEFQLLGRAVWIDSNNVLRLLGNDNPFDGFDEIYLMERLPKQSAVPEKIYTSERCNFGGHIPTDFLGSFLEMGAVRYISDGCGMNFACESMEIVKKLEYLNEASH